MIIWSKKIDEILKIGHSLEDVGVQNWALSKEQSLEVLEKFLKLEVSILGGDVYEKIDGITQSNCDSWYCEKIQNETNIDFVRRSIIKAKKYIEMYDYKKHQEIFFVFVPDISEHS